MELSDTKSIEPGPFERARYFKELLQKLCDPKETQTDYVIEKIEPRRGKSLRFIHTDVENAPCYIVGAQRGERALLMCLLDYDPTRYHRLHTSKVSDVIESCDGKTVVIVTENTYYTLKRTNFSKSFRGIQKYGDGLAYVLP